MIGGLFGIVPISVMGILHCLGTHTVAGEISPSRRSFFVQAYFATSLDQTSLIRFVAVWVPTQGRWEWKMVYLYLYTIYLALATVFGNVGSACFSRCTDSYSRHFLRSGSHYPSLLRYSFPAQQKLPPILKIHKHGFMLNAQT